MNHVNEITATYRKGENAAVEYSVDQINRKWSIQIKDLETGELYVDRQIHYSTAEEANRVLEAELLKFS